MIEEKTAYICGPLTELDPALQKPVKIFYEQIADVYGSITGTRGFVPHEHYDPIKHSAFLAKQVDLAERRQVSKMTTIMIVVAIAPSWGGGIEVEMANKSKVPVVILYKKDKKISRLLLGNPAVKDVISYDSGYDALMKLGEKLETLLSEVPVVIN